MSPVAVRWSEDIMSAWRARPRVGVSAIGDGTRVPLNEPLFPCRIKLAGWVKDRAEILDARGYILLKLQTNPGI